MSPPSLNTATYKITLLLDQESHKGVTILIKQATISIITNLVYKNGNLARLNSLLMLLALGTRHISKASLVLILIGTTELQLITAQARLDGLELSRSSY
jgi:hypothetical protein